MKNESIHPPSLLGFYCSSIAWGGLEMNTVRYAVWMQQLGYDVHVYCVENSPIHRQALSHQLRVELVRRNKKYLDLLNAYRVSHMMRTHGVELIWFRDTRDMDLLFWSKKLFRLRIPLLYQQAMQFGVSKKDIAHTLRFRSIDAWVSTLPFLAEQVRTMTHYPDEKIHVIPLGVAVDAESPSRSEARKNFGLADNAFVIGLMGRIDPLKGQHELIDALRILHRAGHCYHVLLVGDQTLHEGHAYRQTLQQQIERFQLQDYVHMHPHTQAIANFYSSIDCFAMCSKGETFGTVTLEAMKYAVPVVATNTGGSPEIVDHGNCGLLYPPGDAAALATAISHIALNEDESKAMVLRASNRFEEEFSAEISLQRMARLVDQLLGNKNEE